MILMKIQTQRLLIMSWIDQSTLRKKTIENIFNHNILLTVWITFSYFQQHNIPLVQLLHHIFLHLLIQSSKDIPQLEKKKFSISRVTKSLNPNRKKKLRRRLKSRLRLDLPPKERHYRRVKEMPTQAVTMMKNRKKILSISWKQRSKLMPS